MTKTISQFIATLQKAQEKHGDLPLYMPETDIGRVDFIACRDGVSREVDGVPEEPNEIVMTINAVGDW